MESMLRSDACTKSPSTSRKGHITCLDIGGTWTRVGRWDRSGGLTTLKRVRTPSRTNDSKLPTEDLIDHLVSLTASLLPPDTFGTVGVSVGAALNHETGTVYGSAPLWGDVHVAVSLGELLRERRPDLEWVMVNDVTAMLYAYRSAHPEISSSRVVVTTISSGIATRTDDPVNGEIPTDPSGLQGEIGHLPATIESPRIECACGEMNHIASFSSGPGLRATADKLAEGFVKSPLEALAEFDRDGGNFEQAFSNALQHGDSFALYVLYTAVRPLADMFTYLLTTQPTVERIVLAGGVIEAIGEPYRDALLSRMYSHGVYLTAASIPDWAESVITIPRSPVETSPLLGAALAASPLSGEGAT